MALLQGGTERARIPGAGKAVTVRIDAHPVTVRAAFGQEVLLRLIRRRVFPAGRVHGLEPEPGKCRGDGFAGGG